MNIFRYTICTRSSYACSRSNINRISISIGNTIRFSRTTYSIYKNLVAVLELSYLFQDISSNVWRNADGEGRNFSDAWRAALNFRYKF